MTEPAPPTTQELLEEVRAWAARYSGNRHKGQTFRHFALLVEDLLDRLDTGDPETTALEIEYAPVLGNGLVLDHLATLERLDIAELNGMRLGYRLVSDWRYDDGPMVH